MEKQEGIENCKMNARLHLRLFRARIVNMILSPIFHRRLPHALCAALLVTLPTGYAAPPLPVIVKPVEKVDFSDRIEALGTLRANESVNLTATESERVIYLGFEDGQRVKKGDLLLRLSSSEEEALLNEAKATADEAGLQFDRARQLAARGAAATAQLDEARRIYDTAKARVVAIESRLANLVVHAPFDGVVGLRNISIGAVLQPGDSITTLDDDSKMLLDFSVPSTFLPVLRPGLPIQAKAAGYEQKVFQGSIRSISSRIDPATRSVTVRAEIPNEERLLKPGLLMSVELKSNPRQALLVNEEAILPVGDRNFVLLVEQGDSSPVVRRREVRLGARVPGRVEILDGLSEGDQVVTHGTLRVVDGSAVKITSVDTGEKSIREQIQSADQN